MTAQVWIGRRGRSYHDHALSVPGAAAPVPFLVHRHNGGDVSHHHDVVECGPRGTHAADVDDVTPLEDPKRGLPVLPVFPASDEGGKPEDFARELRGVRRRHAEMEAAL